MRRLHPPRPCVLTMPPHGTLDRSTALNKPDTSSEPLAVRVGKRDCPSPHSLLNKILRVIWGLCWITLFRPSPRPFFLWRRMLLRIFGARIGSSARIDPSVRIWVPWRLSVGTDAALGAHVVCYNLAPITIGAHATVSQYTHLCAGSHDITDPHMSLIAQPIIVGEQAWVCANAFVGPGVRVGNGAIVGAASVVMRDVTEWTVVVGNPARYLKDRVLTSRQPA